MGSFMSKHSHASKMYSSTETNAQKSKNLLGENPIVNRAGS